MEGSDMRLLEAPFSWPRGWPERESATKLDGACLHAMTPVDHSAKVSSRTTQGRLLLRSDCERICDLLQRVSIAHDDVVQIQLLLRPSHATSVRKMRKSNCCRGSDNDEWYLSRPNLSKYNAPRPPTAVIYVRKR